MIKEFVEAWDKNKDALRLAIEADKSVNRCKYKYLVELLFEHVINPYNPHNRYKFDVQNMHVIDDGEYQGALVFILHASTYQPCPIDYVCTYVYYGSCSGCDTLQAIQSENYDGFPTEKQVDAYMTLCLHLLQRCKYMYEYGENDSMYVYNDTEYSRILY